MKKLADEEVVKRLFSSYARPHSEQERFSRLHSQLWIDVFAPLRARPR